MKIYSNAIRNEYDIRPLIMSFFPGQTLEYVVDENIAEKDLSGGSEDNDGLSIFADDDVTAVLILTDEYIDVITKDKTWHTITGAAADDTKEYRDLLKRHIYNAFKEITGRGNRWGTLTGVRPSKIPMAYINKGYTYEQAVDEMINMYYCSPEKAKLCTDIAAVEKNILEKTDYKNGYSIYIGIPFCPTVCNYCSFSSIPLAGLKKADELVAGYMDALGREIEEAHDLYPDRKITSIYVGGGTPTALDEHYLGLLMDMIHKNFNVDQTHEFCVEAGRPDSITEEKLKILKDAGVTRISVNPQTMKEETLVLMGRRHTPEQIITAYDMARDMGFDNINMDLIAGLMGETYEDFTDTFGKITAMDPDSITVHSLVVKRAAQYRKEREESGTVRDDTIVEQMVEHALNAAYQHGYHPYYMYRQKNKAGLGDNGVLENIGYSKPGKEGIYNILIMEEMQSIIAYGAGASSKFLFGDRIERVVNVKNVNEYISRIDEMIDRKSKWF